MKKGGRIEFVYKGGRRVAGEITNVGIKTIVIILETDYRGKNDLWEKGAVKIINIGEMKSIITIYSRA